MAQTNKTMSLGQKSGNDGRFTLVRKPAAHDGIARALRMAYRPDDGGILPDTMQDLLAQLDAIPVAHQPSGGDLR